MSGPSEGGQPVSIRVRFDRFPATVKGAFVVRGDDADPHQVAIHGARLVRLPGGSGPPVPLAPVTLDAPPHQNLFVPFEVSVADLEPGWYGFELDVDVDGSPRTQRGDRRFVVSWPRGAVRTGTVRVDREVAVGELTVSLERIQCERDSASVRFRVRPPAPVSVRVDAGRHRIESVDLELDEGTGVGTAMTYPVLRAHGTLRVEFGSGRDRGELSVELP